MTALRMVTKDDVDFYEARYQFERPDGMESEKQAEPPEAAATALPAAIDEAPKPAEAAAIELNSDPAPGERPAKLVWSKPTVRELFGEEKRIRLLEVDPLADENELPPPEQPGPERKLEQPADDVRLISEADAEPQAETLGKRARRRNGSDGVPAGAVDPDYKPPKGGGFLSCLA